MNIFFLSESPVISARYLCDKHVPKMLLESAQMLSTAMRKRGCDMGYKSAYPNHPMTIWVGECRANFTWTLYHARELAREYTARYGKHHASKKVIDEFLFLKTVGSYRQNMTEPPQSMPDEYKDNDYVTAYRNYYKGEKTFAKWEKGRSEPRWWS